MMDAPNNQELDRRVAVLERYLARPIVSEGTPKRDWLALFAIIGTGLTLAALIVPGLNEVRRDVSDLRERMAVVETLLTKNQTPDQPAE